MMVTVIAPHHPPRSKQRQVVFSFHEGTSSSRRPEVRGGKGANLAEMVTLGLPVPPGFTVSTTVARAFLATGQFPTRLRGQLERSIARLERETGKGFGDADNPLLVSVRSGAQASMPGMMDTVLNVGLTPATVEGLARHSGEGFAYDVYRRFLCQYGQVVLGTSEGLFDRALVFARHQLKDTAPAPAVETLRFACDVARQFIGVDSKQDIPDDPYQQLMVALTSVQRSWMNERAIAYRAQHNLPNWWGTAVTVQSMVFGNYDGLSGTGVVFSHDVNTGRIGLFGEFLPQAQGEDVVSGERTPLPLADMAVWAPEIHQELKNHVSSLARHYDDMVDVEFTVENGRLYLLQVRRAKRTALAAATQAVHRVWNKQATREAAVATLSQREIAQLSRPEFNATEHVARASGLAASPGAAVGRVVTSSSEAQQWAARGEKVVLVARDTTPDDLPGMLCAAALVTGVGGTTCHAAVVARELGLPAVVGVGEDSLTKLTGCQFLSVDGTSGLVYDGSIPFKQTTLTKEVKLFLDWSKRFACYQPRIDFASIAKTWSLNDCLNDFYVSDSMATSCRDTTYEARADDLRTTIHQSTAEMLAAYLVVAVAGELRHADEHVGGMDDQLSILHNKFRVTDVAGRNHAQYSVLKALQKLPEKESIQFFRLAVQVFGGDSWGAGYGGAAWMGIAEAALNFLTGAWTPSIFVDHVFDLRHNGDVMFDKHTMVETRTDEGHLKQQLEVKKTVIHTGRLFGALACYGGFSPAVKELHKQGLTAHLW